MHAGSLVLAAKTRVKEFGRIRRIDVGERLFLVASGEGEMLDLIGTYVGEEIEGSHYTSLADSIAVEHVDDLLALIEQVPKYLGSIKLAGLLVRADTKTNVAREVVIVAEEGLSRRVIVKTDIGGVFEDKVTPLEIASWIEAKF